MTPAGVIRPVIQLFSINIQTLRVWTLTILFFVHPWFVFRSPMFPKALPLGWGMLPLRGGDSARILICIYYYDLLFKHNEIFQIWVTINIIAQSTG